MATHDLSVQRELAALREGLERLAERVAELREDIRDLRAEVVGIRNGQLMFSAAMVAGLLGVIATLIVTV